MFLTVMSIDFPVFPAGVTGEAVDQKYTDTVSSIIVSNNGVFAKGSGNNTLSYFEDAQDGVRAAAQIQENFDELNLANNPGVQALLRIGLYTGNCSVEGNIVSGEAVTMASIFGSAASPGEIFFSESTYDALANKEEIGCKNIGEIASSDNKKMTAYKAFWNKEEIETQEFGHAELPPNFARRKLIPPMVKLLLIVLVPIGIVFLYPQMRSMLAKFDSSTDERSFNHTATITGDKRQK